MAQRLAFSPLPTRIAHLIDTMGYSVPAAMGAKVVTPEQAPQLHAMVDRLCAMADMPKPRIAVADTGPGIDLDEYTRTLIERFANPEITKALNEGQLFLLLQHIGFRTDGENYTLVPWPAKPASEGCAFQTSNCAFNLERNAFQEDCSPRMELDNATVTGTAFHAGGPAYNFMFEFPLMAGVQLVVPLYFATIEGTVTLSGGQLVGMQGILGGAIPKESMREALLAVPPDQLTPEVGRGEHGAIGNARDDARSA